MPMSGKTHAEGETEMDHIKKFWTVYGALLISVFTYISPYLAAEISKHPHGTELLGAAAFIVGKLSQSPVSKP